MSLSSILKEMENNRPNAEAEVSTSNSSTYGARVGLKRAAVEALKRLRTDYRNELMNSTVFIVVTGANSDQFTELASGESFGCFSADPEALYKELVSKVNPTLFGRENTRQLFNILGNVLEDKALELDINSYPMLRFDDRYNQSVTSAEEFVPVVKRALNEQVGSELVGVNAIHSLVDSAINKGHSAPITPLVLNTSDEKFALDLNTNLKRLTQKVFLVAAGKATREVTKANGAITVKNVTEETVAEALSLIRTKVL